MKIPDTDDLYTYGYSPLAGFVDLKISNTDLMESDLLHVNTQIMLKFNETVEAQIFNESGQLVKPYGLLLNQSERISGYRLTAECSFDGTPVGTVSWGCDGGTFGNNITRNNEGFIKIRLTKRTEGQAAFTSVPGSEIIGKLIFSNIRVVTMRQPIPSFIINDAKQIYKANKEKSNQELAYKSAIKTGEDCLENKNFDCALENFKKASTLKPNDPYAKGKMKEASEKAKKSNKPVDAAKEDNAKKEPASASAVQKQQSAPVKSKEEIAAEIAAPKLKKLDDGYNQMIEDNKRIEERSEKLNKSYYVAYDAQKRLAESSNLIGNYESVEELEREFAQKYQSIGDNVYNAVDAENAHYKTAANEAFSESDERTKAYGQAAVELGTLINSWNANNRADAERENLMRQRELHLKELAAKKVARRNAMRKTVIETFKDGGVPLSYHKVPPALYFFAYSFSQDSLESDFSILRLTNVFQVDQYNDGTWPFKNNILADLKNKGLIGDLRIIGFYSSKQDADNMRASMESLANKSEFTIKAIEYKGKKAKQQSAGVDYWAPPTNTLPSNNQTIDNDYWK